MRLFRRVTQNEAQRDFACGFTDHTSTYLTGQELSGVWVSDLALDCNDFGNIAPSILLQIDLAVSEYTLSGYEYMGDGKVYREWLVPADLLNALATIQVIDEGAGPPLMPPPSA